MTSQRVDFYLLNQSVPDGKLRAACRLSKKAHARDMTTYLQVSDAAEAARLDDMLWTFDQGSFIPHRLDRDDTDPAPLAIGWEPPRGNPPDLLVALAGNDPGQFQDCPRVAEVVDATDEDKQAARRRYKTYKDSGCELDTHHIDP